MSWKKEFESVTKAIEATTEAVRDTAKPVELVAETCKAETCVNDKV